MQLTSEVRQTGDLRVEGLAVPVLTSQQCLLSQRDEAVYVRWGKRRRREQVAGAGFFLSVEHGPLQVAGQAGLR